MHEKNDSDKPKPPERPRYGELSSISSKQQVLHDSHAARVTEPDEDSPQFELFLRHRFVLKLWWMAIATAVIFAPAAIFMVRWSLGAL